MRELRQRQPRMLDEGYLVWLRKRRCAFCGRFPGDEINPIEAAHLRMAAPFLGKRYTGHREKPDDKWATPLCRWCHQTGPEAQHKIGEHRFWGLAEINPFILAMELYAEYGGEGGRPQRKRTTIKLRLPKEKRAKIAKRKASWPRTRSKLRSRRTFGTS